MQPDVDELRNIRNSYYNNNTYDRNKRENSDRLRNRLNRSYYKANESDSSDSSDNEYDTSYHYRRRTHRKRDGLFQKIKSIVNTIFDDDEKVIHCIIVINVIVYLLWEYAIYEEEVNYDSSLLEFMHNNFTISWTHLIKEKRYWTIITSMFSHEDIMHLANNMLTFYSFSKPVIRYIGKKKFIMAYLLSGLSSSFAHAIFYHVIAPKLNRKRYNILYDLFFSIYVKNSYDNVSGLGASGAITGINTIFSCLYPTSRITYKNYLRLPAWLTMTLFILGDFYRSLTLSNGNIDTIGHVGGGIAGYIFYLYSLKPFIYR